MERVQYVSVIEDTIYMTWQQEVQLYNFKKLGIAAQLWIVVLYCEAAPQPCIDVLRKKHPVPTQVRYYRNTQPLHFMQAYRAMNKPFGIAQLLKDVHVTAEARRALHATLYSLDADVIFKQAPHYDSKVLFDTKWYGSNCAAYLNRLHWLNDKHLTERELARVIGIVRNSSLSSFATLDSCCIGAQLLFKHVNADFFDAVAQDAWCIYDALKEIHDAGKPNQFWVAEMLSFVLHILRVKGSAGLATNRAFDFAWATSRDDDVYRACNIIHMAGKVDAETFDKQAYITRSPWDDLDDLRKYVTIGASSDYVKVIQNYALERN